MPRASSQGEPRGRPAGQRGEEMRAGVGRPAAPLRPHPSPRGAPAACCMAGKARWRAGGPPRAAAGVNFPPAPAGTPPRGRRARPERCSPAGRGRALTARRQELGRHGHRRAELAHLEGRPAPGSEARGVPGSVQVRAGSAGLAEAGGLGAAAAPLDPRRGGRRFPAGRFARTRGRGWRGLGAGNEPGGEGRGSRTEARGAPLRTGREADPAQQPEPGRQRLRRRTAAPAPTCDRDTPVGGPWEGSLSLGVVVGGREQQEAPPGFTHAAPRARRPDSGPGQATNPRAQPGDHRMVLCPS